MKPRTKIQKHIIDLRSELPKIDKDQKKFIQDKHHKYFTTKYKYQIHCLECGHNWKDDGAQLKAQKKTTCPKCKNKLSYTEWNDVELYTAILQTIGDFQVVRHFYSLKHLSKGQKAKTDILEVINFFIDQKGKVYEISRLRNTFSGSWRHCKGLEFRSTSTSTYYSNSLFYINPHFVYPKQSVLPILKRNGYKTSTHNIAPQVLFSNLLTSPKVETLFKAKQYRLLKAIIKNRRIEERWTQIKIAIREKYTVKDPESWIDYIRFLKDDKKDICNPDYLCPKDFKKAHRRYVAIHRAKQEEMQRQLRERHRQEQLKKEENRKRAMAEYNKRMKKFASLKIKHDEYFIEPIMTIEEMKNLGNDLLHCIFSSHYYAKENSLLLKVMYQGKPIETAEIYIDNLQLSQCRGYDNKPSKKHHEIVDLIERNKNKIRRAVRASA